MSNFDETMKKAENPKKSPEEYKAMMQQRREQRSRDVEAALNKAVSSADEFLSFLSVQSHFDRYSLDNNLLIYAQRPTATRLQSVEDWNAEKKWVKEGAKAVYIYEMQKKVKDGVTYNNMIRKAKFDVTDLQDAPEEKPVPYSVREIGKALFDSKTVTVRTVPDYPEDRQFGALYDAEDNCIYLRPNMPIENIVMDVTMALAHAKMAKDNPDYNAADYQFEARCTAYVVAQKFGIDAKHIGLTGLPAFYGNGDFKQIHERLQLLHDNVYDIAGGMNLALMKMKAKEKENAPKAKTARGGDAR